MIFRSGSHKELPLKHISRGGFLVSHIWKSFTTRFKKERLLLTRWDGKRKSHARGGHGSNPGSFTYAKKCVTCDLSRKMISLLFLVLPISTYSQHKCCPRKIHFQKWSTYLTASAITLFRGGQLVKAIAPMEITYFHMLLVEVRPSKHL